MFDKQWETDDKNDRMECLTAADQQYWPSEWQNIIQIARHDTFYGSLSVVILFITDNL